MSSIPTKSQQQQSFAHATPLLPHHQHQQPGQQKPQQGRYLHEKRHYLIRSASLERIVKFNAYICSQNYFLLPSLLAWLKTSQTAVQAQIERCILHLRCLLFVSLAHHLPLLLARLRSAAGRAWTGAYESDAGSACEMLLFVLHHSIAALVLRLQRKVLALCVYLTVLLIFVQLAFCFYLMSGALPPGGLVFLCVCLYLISHLNTSVLFHYVRSHRERAGPGERRPRRCVPIRNKTISDVNLF